MSSNSEVNFEDCPVGIKNASDIGRVEDRLNMAIEKLTDKVEELQDDVTSLQVSVNTRFDKVDRKIEDLETKLESQINHINKHLPEKIDERIELSNQRKKALSIDKIMAIILGVISTVLGGVALVAVKTMLKM